MPRHDLQCEWAYYGGGLDTIGMLYLRGAKLPAKYPDVLFFLLYTCHLLTDKKLAITGVNFIVNGLKQNPEDWEKIFNWEEDRPFTAPCRTIPYRGYARSALSASLLFRDKIYFRSGRMGFGFFSNGKHFTSCAGGSVFALLETIYNANSKEPPENDEENRRRRTNAEQRRTLSYLWQATDLIRRLDMGRDVNRGNCNAVAVEIYRRLTGDDYPRLEQYPKLAHAGLDRIFEERKQLGTNGRMARQARCGADNGSATGPTPEAAAEADDRIGRSE